MTNMVEKSIKKLVCYGLECGLFTERDQIFVTNRILEILNWLFLKEIYNENYVVCKIWNY